MKRVAPCVLGSGGGKPPDDLAELGLVLVGAEGAVGERLQVESVRSDEGSTGRPCGEDTVQAIRANGSRRVAHGPSHEIAPRTREESVRSDRSCPRRVVRPRLVIQFDDAT